MYYFQRVVVEEVVVMVGVAGRAYIVVVRMHLSKRD